MERYNRVSLLITETDTGQPDPQALARISLRGKVELLPQGAPGYTLARSIYVQRFPQSEKLFSFADFNLWKFIPKGGRYVAGLGKAYNIVPDSLQKVSAISG
jgi:hypothetical protein